MWDPALLLRSELPALKAIATGFPLTIVVTASQIADCLANQMHITGSPGHTPQRRHFIDGAPMKKQGSRLGAKEVPASPLIPASHYLVIADSAIS